MANMSRKRGGGGVEKTSEKMAITQRIIISKKYFLIK